MKRIALICGFVLAPLLAATNSFPQPLGRTLYVSNTDPACGGKFPCYTTIQAAVNAASQGDIVRIQAGTYTERLTIDRKNNISAATEKSRIVIESDPEAAPGGVVLRPPPASCLNGQGVLIRRSKFVTLRGLTITGATNAAVVLLGGPQQNQAIHIERSRIVGNSSSNCPGGGITIALGNPDTLIVNTLIHGNGGNGIIFADPSGGPHWLVQNTIHGNGWNGIGMVLGHTVTIANNVITANGNATGTLGGRYGVQRLGLPKQTPGAVRLLNNLICGNRLGEIQGPILDNGDSGNLTPQGNEGPGVNASATCGVATTVYANLNGTDQLANTPDDDFNLADNSPAIDRGMDARALGLGVLFNPIVEADYDETAARPSDGNADRQLIFDIGAFERVNQRPVANAGSDQTVSKGAVVTLNGSQSSDPEGAALTYQWTLLSQPPGSAATLGNPASVNPQFTPAVFGNYVTQLIVNDGESSSAPDTVQVSIVNRAPTANAGGPYTGAVGIPIQFAGLGQDPDGDAVTFNWNFGDGGLASGATPMHTYTAPGNFIVALTTTDSFGASAVSQTTVTVTAALVLNPIGNKAVNLGETLTFTVSASNPSGGPISLFVAPLPLPNHATFNAAAGLFTFRPDTTQVGTFQLTFTAVSGNKSVSETITITVPNPPPGGLTAVRGRIYNLNNTPLGNVKVTLRASGHTAFSGNDGFFTMSGVPPDRQELIVNGREANLGVYAILAVSVDLIQGVFNNLASPITLPDVDVEAEVQVSSIFTTVVTNPNVPGVELTILAGTARNSDGTPFTGKLSINPVPDYGRPESRPEELRPGMAITIQPAGIRFNPPARLTFPNADGIPPGNELNLWSLSPDTGTFNIVGKTVVSADGQSLVTVEGGVSASAWHFPLASSPTPLANQGNNFCGSCRTQVGSEANLEEGSLYMTHALPFYRSLGQSRSVSLTYSSVTADPRPVIALDTALTVRAAVPNTFSTRLKVGGVQQGGEVFTDTRSLPEDADSNSRLSVQFDASNLATGRYPYEATVFSNYLNSSIGGITTGNAIVVNRKNNPLGSGWAVTDLQQIHPQADGGVLLTSGDGTALFFLGGPDTFTSPARDFSTLIRSPDGTYARSLKDGTTIHFNAQGLQTSVVDRNSNITSYAYDAGGKLIAITDPIGLVTTLTYSSGKLQRITDPAGRQTLFQFDSAGNLSRISNPDNTFLTYGYDGQGHITQAIDERGNGTIYAYDFAGRFKQSTKPGGETRSVVPTKLQGLADTGAGQGTPTHPAPIVQTQDAGASVTDGKGNATRYVLDSLGQIISQSDALDQTTTIQRDANGLPTRITRPNGAVSTMTYDTKGNLLTSIDPMGAATTFTYESNFNQVKTIRDPKGNTTTINYDANGNPIEIIDALGRRTQMTYDSRGLLTSVISAVGTSVQTTTTFTHDARGNLLTTTNPQGDVTTFAYDNAGNVFRSTDAENRVSEFTYDARNRLISVLDADLKLTQYGYDSKGNLTQVRDAKNQFTTFVYDGLDRLISATGPLGLTETFTYDGNGNLTSTTNRNGQTITFNYDALNRLTSKARPPTSSETGNQTTTFAYDSAGNLTSAINPTIGIFNIYDATNRLVSSTSSTENVLSGSVIPINADTVIGENDFQFEGKTLQVNGKALTVDGSHVFANLILVNGAVLTQSPTTATKVNRIDLVVTGNLQVDGTSRIDASARGFLGGAQPGNPFGDRGMTVGFAAGSVGGSGGSYGGLGGPANGSANPVYGVPQNPIDPGSGGSTIFRTGGNGGGVIRISAQNLVLTGSIRADGGTPIADSFAGGGSGGAIRIDVETLSGSGQITARGGNGLPSSGGGAGGRIAIYYQNIDAFNLDNVLHFGGTGSSGPNGGAGTFYLRGAGRESGELITDNGNKIVGPGTTPISPTAVTTIFDLRVRRGARAIVSGQLSLRRNLEVSSASQLVLNSGTVDLTDRLQVSAGSELILGVPAKATTADITGTSTVTQTPTTGSALFKVDISAETLTIDGTSKIDVSARGFLGAGQNGNPFESAGMTVGFQSGSNGFSGGSYGGFGASGGGTPPSPNPVYGDFRNPNEPGSGGAGAPSAGRNGGNGGGLVRIVADTINLDGQIVANGGSFSTNCCEGGGSGGGIRIDVGTLSGTGVIGANGGNGSTSGGGGGGGRVAIYYQNITGFSLNNVTAFGESGINVPNPNGGAGTFYLQGPGREGGELVVDNGNISAASQSTQILNAATGIVSLTHLRVLRHARLRIDNLVSLSGTLEVNSSAEFISADRVLADVITLSNSSTILQVPITGIGAFKIDLTARAMTVDATSTIDAIARGFLGGGQTGNPFSGSAMSLGFAQGSTGTSGGSYGGLGGPANGSPNSLYGTAQDPKDPGSGGATIFRTAGNGGGVIKVAAQSLTLNGGIRASGGSGIGDSFAAGGSGGSIRIDVGTLTGAGQIAARGGNGLPSSGGGGGGRIAIYYSNATGFNLGTQVLVTGGTGNGAPNGQNGTIHLQQQIAMLTPIFETDPVMRAEAENSTAGDPVRFASVDLPFTPHPSFSFGLLPDIRVLRSPAMAEVESVDRSQRRIFSSVSEIQNPKSEIQENRYLAMLTEKEPKPGSCCSTAEADFDPIYTYDVNGNRISMIDPTGLTTYSYDVLNRLTSMTNNRGQTTTFTYDALGRRTSMTHINGVVTTYQYDPLSQLTQLAHQLGATTINSFDYTYDKVGNRKTKIDRNGSYDYTYDTLNRVTQAINPLPSNPLESFTYDPVGNRTNSNQNGASTFNQANQLLEDANFTYQYDNNGNLTRKTPKVPGPFNSYEYDAENKLVRVVKNGTAVNYKYDALGRRVEKEIIEVGTAVTRYVYDNEDILLELNGSNQVVARYTHGAGIDEPLIIEKNSESFYYHSDGLGSVTELTDQSGTVIQRYAYSSFGKIESQLDPSFVQPYTYTSREFDTETGLSYYRARYYESSIGRFISEDPIGFAAGPNSYAYVGNNPIKRIDPSGLFFTPDTVIDAGFILYDIYKLVADDSCSFNENLATLGLDVIGAIVPGVTGLGAASRVARNVDEIYVIGRRWDTAVAIHWPGHKILDIKDWSIPKNDEWIQNIMDKKASVYLGSPTTADNLTHAISNEPTVFARELEQLTAAGYKRVGDYLLPPGR
jgi:RHS repeat-associated protein